MRRNETRVNEGGASRRVCVTAAQFGLSLAEAPAREARREWSASVGCCALVIDALLAPGRCCLITGPSGSGKTTLLRRLAGATPRRVIDVGSPRFDVGEKRTGRGGGRGDRGDMAVVDLFTLPLDATVRLLAAAGLAEAPLLVRRARDLSEGQRFRLRLSLSMAAAMRARARGGCGVTIVADEFCASLDDETAASVATGLSRWARASGVRVVVAAGHGGLRRFLWPQLVAVTGLYREPEVLHVHAGEDDGDGAGAAGGEGGCARRAG